MPVPSRIVFRALGSLAVLALLQACASRPQTSASTEAYRYRARAHHNYRPPGPPGDPWGPYIREASRKYDVPQQWIRAVMHQESGGHLYLHGQLTTSSAGAMGLMQVMPATYDDLRSRYPSLGDDPFNPHDNIMAGTAYLREMYDIYGAPGFLAAYNAGPGRLDDYLTRNRPLPTETRRYVAAIGPHLGGSEPRHGSPGAQFAMNAIGSDIPAGPRYATPIYTPPAIPARQYAEYRPAPLPEPVRYSAPITPPSPPRMIAQVEPYRPVVARREPAPAPRVFQVAELPEPPRPVPARRTPAPREVLAETPRAALRTELARLAERRPALPLPPALPAHMPFQLASVSQRLPGHGFHLIAPAMAEPIGVRHNSAGTGRWAIQVGAFASSTMAATAAAAARQQARGDLGHARGSVTEIRHGRATLYRARLQGLSHGAAASACERLAKHKTSCLLVSPDAQS